MEGWTLYIIGYLVVGIAAFAVLWKWFGIEWKNEAADTKLIIAVSPVAWPFVLLFIFGVWISEKVKKK